MLDSGSRIVDRGPVVNTEGAKFKLPEASKDTSSHEYHPQKLRAMKGALENPTDKPETFKLNEKTRQTLVNVATLEYKFCQEMVQANLATLKPVIEKIRLNQPLTLTEEGQITSAGMRRDQLEFYIDFTSDAPKLETDDNITKHANEWRKRDDRLLRVVQLAEDQLKVYQRVANADLAEKNIRPDSTVYQSGVQKFGDELSDLTIQDLNLKTPRYKRILKDIQQRFAQSRPQLMKQNIESLIRQAVRGRDVVQREIDKSDPYFYFDGVKYYNAIGPHRSQQALIDRGPVSLSATSKYEKFLLNANNVRTTELADTTEMKKYAQLLLDRAAARIDVYRHLTDGEFVNPKAFNLVLDAVSPTGFRLDQNAQAIADLEREFPGRPDLQRRYLQERILKNTQEEMAKKEKELAEEATKTALDQHITQWKQELRTVNPAEEQKNEQEIKKKQDDIDKNKEEKKKSLRKEEIEVEIKQQADTLNDIGQRTGLTVNEIADYDKRLREADEKRKKITRHEARIGKLREDLALVPQVPHSTRTVPSLIKGAPDQVIESEDQSSPEWIQKNSLLNQLSSLRTEVLNWEDEIDQANNENTNLINSHSSSGLDEQLLQKAHRSWQVREKALNEKAGMITQVGNQVNYDAIAKSDEIQKQIDVLEEERKKIGVDRLENRALELLEVYQPMLLQENDRAERLQRHHAGTLPGIPDVPHLAQYPRPILRVYQILFGEGILNLDKFPDLQQKMKLIPPEDVVRLAAVVGVQDGSLDMYDPRWNQNIDMYSQRISDTFIRTIMDELEARVWRKTLGLGPAMPPGIISQERQNFEDILILRNTNKTKSMDETTKIAERARPDVVSWVEHNAAHYYYYESIEDLARRLILHDMPSLPLESLQQWYLFLAEELDRWRTEHPKL